MTVIHVRTHTVKRCAVCGHSSPSWAPDCTATVQPTSGLLNRAQWKCGNTTWVHDDSIVVWHNDDLLPINMNPEEFWEYSRESIGR